MSSQTRRMSAMVALALVTGFLATGCGSDSSDAPASSPDAPASSNAPTASPDTPTGAARSYKSFQLPSRNIACAIGDGPHARCEVRKKTFTPPAKPGDCPLDWGTAIAVEGNRRGAFICHGDTVMNPGAPKLRYGESSVVRPIRCDSSAAGVECRNTKTGHGFFLARERFRTF